MARYKIYGKGSSTTDEAKAEVSKLTYSGTWMQECSLTVTVNSPAPVDFAVGDYIDYRGERFWIDTDPGVKKQARAGYSGEGFVYDNLMFYNAIRELKVCDFLDYVKNEMGRYTYSAASSVVFFAATVEDFANRIQANLDRLYTKDNKWQILVDSNITDKDKTFDGAGNQIVRDKTVSISNAKIFDILSEIENTFHTTYTIRGRVIKIGFAPEDVTPSTDDFEYYDEKEGKRKGLVSLEKTVNSQYSVITRLRAYGSERNLPSRYYANRYTTIKIGNEDMPRYGVISTEAGDGNKNMDFLGFGEGGTYYRYYSYNWFVKTSMKLPIAYTKIQYLDDKDKWMYVATWMKNSVARQMFPNWNDVSFDLESGEADQYHTILHITNATAVAWRDTSKRENAQSTTFYLGFWLKSLTDADKETIKNVFANQDGSWSQDPKDYPTIYSVSGFCADAFDETYKIYDSKADTLTLSVFNLMLPGFPTKSLQDYVYGTSEEEGSKELQNWIKECYGTADALNGHLSTDKFFPYIDSPNTDTYGTRESNIYFTEDSDDFDEVYPSIEAGYKGNETNYFTFVDETGSTIENSSGYDDQGIYTDGEVGTVGVKVPYAGFDWAEVWTDDMSLSMKNGMCAGREFSVSKVVNIDGVPTKGAILYLERAYDESVQRYFPYKDYPLVAKSDADGGDRYVVLNIEMPTSYVEAAAEVAFKQAVLYLSQHDRPSYIYTPVLSSVYVQREREAKIQAGNEKDSVWYKIKEGSAITFKDEDIMGAESETHIIKTLSIKEGENIIPSYEITIQEDEPETKLSALEKQINSLTSSSSSTTVGTSSSSTSASRKLDTKLNNAWFQELFRAYDANGDEVKPNNESEIDHIVPQVSMQGGEGSSVENAQHANEAAHATNADYAANAGNAENANYAKQADNASKATEADHAAEADKADKAESATYADTAGDLSDDSPVYDKFLRKDISDTAKETITFEKGLALNNSKGIDGNGNATLRKVSVNDMITSPDFVDGMAGHGVRIWGENNLAYMTLDKLTVRQTMNVFELLINKIRSVGGQICVSAANAKIKSVTKSGSGLYYAITFEDSNPFVLGDLIRCQTFTGGNLKSYWVEVTVVSSTGVEVRASEFGDGVVPAEGDECVLMGSTSNTSRQNLVLISATEDGKPRVDVLNGVDSKDFTDSLRARLGNLNDIESSAFPEGLQPQGDGLFADNAYLKGTFILSTGEDVKTRFEVTDAGVTSKVESIRDDLQSEGNHLDNPSFRKNLTNWSTGVASTAFSVSDDYIWANDNFLSRNGSSVLIEDDERKVVRIKAMYLTQLNEAMKNKPDTSAENKAVGVTLSFRYKCISAGTLTAQLVSDDESVLNVTKELAVTDGYETFTATGVWFGIEDLKIMFTGEMYVAMICLRTDNGETLVYRYNTLFQQTDKLVNIAAKNYNDNGTVKESSEIVTTAKANALVSSKFNDDGTLKNTSGLVTTSDAQQVLKDYMKTASFAGMFATAVDSSTNIVKQADISAFVKKDDDGNLESGVKVRADNIELEGVVTANDGFKILSDGSMEATSGKFNGDINLRTLTYENFLEGGNYYTMEELPPGVLKEVAYFCPLITRAGVTITVKGATTSVLFLETPTTIHDKAVSEMSFSGIGKLIGYNILGITYWIKCPYTNI